MKQTVIFSEIENENVYRTAVAFAKLPECEVYVLHKKNERVVEDSDIHVIEIEERRQENLSEAMKCIEEEQGSVDMLVLSAGRHCTQDGRITDGHDYEALLEVIDENVIGNVEVVQASLELMRKGLGKRIALLTDVGASINLNKNVQDFGYHMSQAALNMMEKLLFNQLRPEGFTFRCYAFGENNGMPAQDYLRMNFSNDPSDAYIHSEENRIVMRDGMLSEIPW